MKKGKKKKHKQQNKEASEGRRGSRSKAGGPRRGRGGGRPRSRGLVGGYWEVLWRFWGGSLGSSSLLVGSCGVLRAPAGLLACSWGFIGELLWDLRGLLGALEGQKKSKKPPNKAPRSDAASFPAKFADSITLFPHFAEGDGAIFRKLERGPAECWSCRGGPQEGPEAQRPADLERSCLDLCLSPRLTRRRGGGGSLRAFRRARDSDEESRVDDSTHGIEAAPDNSEKEG